MRLIDADKFVMAVAMTKEKSSHYADIVLCDYAIKMANLVETEKAVFVVRCDECVRNSKCIMEDFLRHSGCDSPYCSAGKRADE